MALEDAVDMAATLRDACRAAGGAPADVAAAFAAMDPAVIADALRAMERRRTARCAPLVDLAHNNAERAVMPKPLLVRCGRHTSVHGALAATEAAHAASLLALRRSGALPFPGRAGAPGRQT
jgi:hypothetical protein